jgi:hypothetical protein
MLTKSLQILTFLAGLSASLTIAIAASGGTKDTPVKCYEGQAYSEKTGKCEQISQNKFDEFNVALPPGRYIEAPAMTVSLRFVGEAEFSSSCARYAAMSDDPLSACAVVEANKTCSVYFKDTALIGVDSFHALLVHELAHCNGWTSDHPD